MKVPLWFVLLVGAFASLGAWDVPPGFREQELKATGGTIILPKDWQLKSHGTSSGWLYIMAPKFHDDGTYITGFRIQLVMDVKNKSGGKTPHEEALRVRDQFKEAAKRLVKECEEYDEGSFRKTCLETMEKNEFNLLDDFHVIYSFFWSDESDMVVVSIFGAPESEWKEAEKIYRVMRGFTLLDKEKMEKAAAEATPAPDVKVSRKQMLGTWRFDDAQGMIAELTLRKDGTFSSRLTRGEEVLLNSGGKWTLDGTSLKSEYLSSSSPRIPIGTRDADTIQEVSDEYIDFLSADHVVRRYHRVAE